LRLYLYLLFQPPLQTCDVLSHLAVLDSQVEIKISQKRYNLGLSKEKSAKRLTFFEMICSSTVMEQEFLFL